MGIDRPATQFVDADGIRLAYLEWPGRPGAKPLLCLPYLSAHKGSFAPLAARLSPECHVYALDLRGRGESDQPADGYGFAYHAADIITFAGALGLEHFTLLGHSFGATTAVYLASVHPQWVDALVLMDGGADPKAATLRAMYPTLHRLEKVYPSLEDYLAAMRALPFYRPWDTALEQYSIDDVASLPGGGVRSRSSAVAIRRDLDLHFQYSMCLHFPALRCPALFLRPSQGLLGDRGHVFSEAEAQAIVAAMPHATRADVPDANHYTMLIRDEPPVLPAIRAFLSGTVL